MATLTALLTACVSASGAAYSWVGADGGAWSDLTNWDPRMGYPNAPGDVAMFRGTPRTIRLGQPRVTVGILEFFPGGDAPQGFHIAGDPDQTLTLNNETAQAQILVVGEYGSGSVISAPLVLAADTEVMTNTAGQRPGLTLAGPVTGPGALIVPAGRLALAPEQDTFYRVSMRGDGQLMKRGAQDAVLTGTLDMALAGDWGGNHAIGGGGGLVLSGATFRNRNQSGRAGLFADAGNRLEITHGAQLINEHNSSLYFDEPHNGILIRDEGSLFSAARIFMNSHNGLIEVADGGRLEPGAADWFAFTGTSNTVRVAGRDLDTGAPAVLDLRGKRFLLSHADSARGNRLIVDAGGIVTNGTIYAGKGNEWSVQQEMMVTNGGLVFAVGGAGNTETYHRNSISNRTVVTGTGSLWNNMGQPFVISGLYAGTALGLDNEAVIEAGGVLTNCTVVIGATPSFRDAATAVGNRLRIADGGAVYCRGDSFVGQGNTWPGHTSTSVSNSVWVVGGERGDALWHLGGHDLHIGFQHDTGRTEGNFVRVDRGGTLSDIGHLHVGSPRSTGNVLFLEGGAVQAEHLTLHPGNLLAPVLDGQASLPARIAGTARFHDGSLLRPEARAGTPPGTVELLVADTLLDEGLALAPETDPESWSMVVDDTTLRLIYRPGDPPQLDGEEGR